MHHFYLTLRWPYPAVPDLALIHLLLTPVSQIHVANFCRSAHCLSHYNLPAFSQRSPGWLSSSCTLPVSRESGERPCGTMSMIAADPTRISHRSFVKFLIIQHWVPRRNEHCHCYSRELGPCRNILSSSLQHSIEFLAASSGWSPKTQWDHFLHGLAEHIKDEIYFFELYPSLNELVDLAIRVFYQFPALEGHFLSQILMHLAREVTPYSISGMPEEEPMQIGRAHLTVMKRCHHLANNLCLYCVEAGHIAAACPFKKRCSPFRGQTW